jgi:uncharacterized protein (DUF433 family)
MIHHTRNPGLGSASDATLDTAAEQAGTKYGPPAWRIRLWREVAAEHPRIQVDPAVMGGEPVIVGTRIPVYVILGYATEFESHEQLAAQFYNEISAADVKAALIFASSLCW